MVKDFITSGYCDLLWIYELLPLRQNSSKKFTYSNGDVSFEVSNVSIFGTIVEVKYVGSKGCLYYIDDGTGVIVCKHNDLQFVEMTNIVEDESDKALHEAAESTKNFVDKSVLSDSNVDDSIFNDQSMQLDELRSIKKNRLMGIQSLWGDILESFTSVTKEYHVGDVVLVHGRLYTFININQLYVNCIRALKMKEEIVRTAIKLENIKKSSEKYFSTPINKPIFRLKRKSGAITFDHIHHNDIKLHPTEKGTSTPKRMSDSERDLGPNKRRSIISPNLDGIITFDTIALNEISYDGNETF